MVTIWGIHNDQPSLDLVGGCFISIGWDAIGDLRVIRPDREKLKGQFTLAYPEDKPGAIPVHAGILMRFGFEMAPGDYVISPNKVDSTLRFGRVTGDYYWDATAEVHQHRRPVEWLAIDVPRQNFSKQARYEIGSAVTLFKVKTHIAEFLAAIEAGLKGPVPSPVPSGDEAAEIAQAEDEPNAERIETYTRDFVIEALHKQLDPYQFEEFIAELLRAMGYRATATQASGDGGVDVIAYRDPLGLEPPIIKVQCKRTLGTIGGPDIQKLAGALAHGGSEVGLFVTLGSFSNDAIHIERTRQDLRLLNGNGLVETIFEHYEQLAPRWKRILPMRRVYVVDKEPEAILS
jgi:restriction system protein